MTPNLLEFYALWDCMSNCKQNCMFMAIVYAYNFLRWVASRNKLGAQKRINVYFVVRYGSDYIFVVEMFFVQTKFFFSFYKMWNIMILSIQHGSIAQREDNIADYKLRVVSSKTIHLSSNHSLWLRLWYWQIVYKMSAPFRMI